MKFTPQDMRGIFGILPTPATADADRWQTRHSVNLTETEKMVRLVTAAEVDIVATTGTFGEGATLTWEELREFVDCVVTTVGGSRPVFAGVTTLNTRDTIERCRALVDIGADGVFVGRPMWLALDERAIIRFYQDLAEALHGVPIVVYDNPIAFKGKISSEAYRRLAMIPEIVASKHTGGPALVADMQAVGNSMTVLPLATAWLEAAQQMPDLALGSWSGSVACAPAANVALAKAIAARDWPLARTVSERLVWAESAMFAGGDLSRFMDYSIQIGHLRFKHAGLIEPGPSRPPYIELPDEYRAGGEECGRRWAEVEREFTERKLADLVV